MNKIRCCKFSSNGTRALVFYILIFLIMNGNIFAQTDQMKVFGFVTDNKTNERLEQVIITIADSVVTTSKKDGYFEFSINPNNYDISAQLLGYEKATKSVKNEDDNRNIKLFFRLQSKTIQTEEITVSGKKFKQNVFSKTYELKPGDLQRIPQFGEPDAFRALQALPGLTSINDFSTQLYVKGGNFDETLISLDNVPIYNPYHLGGIFGMFKTDIIEEQKLYPINYPVKYGDYLSSVLEISTKDGNREELKGSATISLISSSLFIDTPLGKGSLLFSARRTYFDLMAKLFSSSALPYYFYDIFAKYTLPLDDKNLFSVSFLYSKDVFEVFNDYMYQEPNITTEPFWGNNVISLNYTHLFSSKSSLDAILYYSSSHNKADATSIYNHNPTTLYLDNMILDIGGVVKFNYELPGQKFEVGLEIKNIGLNYDWDIGKSNLSEFGFDLEDSFYDFAESQYESKNNLNSYSAYISDNIVVTEKLSAQLGIRSNYLARFNKMFLSPSVKVNYSFSNDILLNFSYGKYYQHLFVVKDQGIPMLDPFSVYFLPEAPSQVPTSDNFAVSLYVLNILENTRLELEGYYKKRENLASSYNKFIPFQLDNGYSTGVDIFLKKEKGTLTGWMSYSWARAVKSNDDYSYYARYDRTHTFKILVDFGLSESWHINMFWTYASGLPFTPVINKYIGNKDQDDFNDYYSEYFYWNSASGRKNSDRTPNYNRLDIGINGSFIVGSLILKPFFQVLNVYNSPNEIFFIKNNSIGEVQTVRGSFIIPTFGLTIEF